MPIYSMISTDIFTADYSKMYKLYRVIYQLVSCPDTLSTSGISWCLIFTACSGQSNISLKQRWALLSQSYDYQAFACSPQIYNLKLYQKYTKTHISIIQKEVGLLCLLNVWKSQVWFGRADVFCCLYSSLRLLKHV